MNASVQGGRCPASPFPSSERLFMSMNQELPNRYFADERVIHFVLFLFFLSSGMGTAEDVLEQQTEQAKASGYIQRNTGVVADLDLRAGCIAGQWSASTACL